MSDKELSLQSQEKHAELLQKLIDVNEKEERHLNMLAVEIGKLIEATEQEEVDRDFVAKILSVILPEIYEYIPHEEVKKLFGVE